MMSRALGTTLSMPATKKSLFKGQRHAKETQEAFPKAMARICKEMTENMKIVLNGLRMASVREEIRALSSKIFSNKEWRKEEDPVSLHNETRRHSKGDGKEETKGKGPKENCPSGKSHKLVCYHFPKAEMPKRNPHVSIGTHQNAHTINPKVVANERIKCVFLHTGKASDNKHQRGGDVTFAIHLQETPELCTERRPWIHVFRYVRFRRTLDGHQQRNTSKCDTVEVRKDTSAQE